MAVRIDLVIPGLFDLPPEELDASFLERGLPALNRFLRYARKLDNACFDLEAILIDAMDWEGITTLPFAEACAAGTPGDGQSWLLFRAVHLKADMHNAIVTPIENNQENNQDIILIINDLKEYFKVDCDLRKQSDESWLMRLKACRPLQNYPHYLSVLGRKADPFVEQSKQALPWYQLVNEMQMFMHAHATNQKRLERGLVAINSLWFWGAGDLAAIGPRNRDWYCDDDLLKRLALAANIECHDLRAVSGADFAHDSLIVDLSLLNLLKSPGQASLESRLNALETTCFEPLMALLRSKSCELRLRAGSSSDLTMGARSAWCWWKKPISLLDRLSG